MDDVWLKKQPTMWRETQKQNVKQRAHHRKICKVHKCVDGFFSSSGCSCVLYARAVDFICRRWTILMLQYNSTVFTHNTRATQSIEMPKKSHRTPKSGQSMSGTERNSARLIYFQFKYHPSRFFTSDFKWHRTMCDNQTNTKTKLKTTVIAVHSPRYVWCVKICLLVSSWFD